MTDFEGKGIIVTGGGRGIGLACARLTAERGGSVVLMGHDSALMQKAQELYAQMD